MAEKGAFGIDELASETGYQRIPEVIYSISVTPQKAIDDALTVLKAHKDSWVTLGVAERVAILEEITRGMVKVADRWVDASLEAKGRWPMRSRPLPPAGDPFHARIPHQHPIGSAGQKRHGNENRAR